MKSRFSLTLRMSLSVGGIICVLLAAILLVGGTGQRLRLNQVLLAENQEIVSARAAEFDSLFDGIFTQMTAFSTAAEFASKDRNVIEAHVRTISRFLPRSAIGCFFAWPDGKIYTAAGQTSNISDRDYFRVVMGGFAPISISDPVMSKTLNMPIIVTSVPVKDPDGRIAGLLGYQIPLTSLSAITSAIKVGTSGYGWLVQSDGLVITHKNQDAVMSLNIREADQKKGYTGMSDFARRMLIETTGFGQWKDPSGVEYTTYFATPKLAPGWKLGISQPSSELAAVINSLILNLLLVCLGALIVAIIATTALSRSIISPLKTAGRGFQSLAKGEADLSKGLVLDRNDEIGDLVADFNDFLAKLREIVVSLKSAQTELNRIGEGLGGSVQGTIVAIDAISADIETVKERGQEEARSVEETSETVKQITRNIESLDGLISDQAASITEASAAIEEMVGNISSVTGSVEKIAAEFSSLLEASESGKSTLSTATEYAAQISSQSLTLAEMNETIAAIASNTNLLAMNAAIEAAHAGESGKGFSVVADEIRRLSETASDQSKNIGAEIESILASIEKIVSASSESSSAFDLVAQRISRTDNLVKEVNHAMSEQVEGSKQILEALREMNEVTSQVQSGSKQMNEGNLAVLKEMASLRQASSEVKDRVEAIATGSAAIASNVDQVDKLAESTRETIGRMEDSIGRFIV